MIDMYTVGLCAMVVLFGSMIALVFVLWGDNKKLQTRMDAVEDRLDVENPSIRDRMITVERKCSEVSERVNMLEGHDDSE